MDENVFDPMIFLKNIENNNFGDCIDSINYGTNLELKYINFQKIDLTNSQITAKEIFNFNIFLIISKLLDYFNKTNIKLTYNASNRNELILINSDFAIKHDIYISFIQDEKYFECGFDFIKKTVYIDEYKYISSLVNLDYFKYFDEDVDKIDVFMDECINRLLIILCLLNNDEFKLAEILFISANRNLSNLQKQLEIYKKIIYGKKNKFVNFNDFFEEIMPVNPETGIDMEYDEFIKYIENNIFDCGELIFSSQDGLIFSSQDGLIFSSQDGLIFSSQNEFISWDDFELIILNLDKNISRIIINYKKVYSQAINTLILALKTINELVQQINKTKKYIPQYITQLLSNDIVNFANKDLLNEIYCQLSSIVVK